MATTKMTKNGSCGCGGTGTGGCGGNCGCAGTTFPGTPVKATSCDTCEEGAFVRPRFFAGQLLTEDDLEAINQYVVGKNRLHNSRLFGDGVVCGFEVVCGPCSGDNVIVKPGYALDCCGNDLVLGCDRQLDIGDMIAALREQLRPGHGCGDPCQQGTQREPCDETDTTTKPDLATVTRLEEYQPDGTLSDERRHVKPVETKYRAPDEYCLYVRYQETPAEPTTPYPVGDDCGNGPCENTRVVEGVTFELRCPPLHHASDDIVSRIIRFLEDLSPDGKIMEDIAYLQNFARKAGRALQRIDADDLEPTAEELAQFHAIVSRVATPVGAIKLEDIAALAHESGLYLRAPRAKKIEKTDKAAEKAEKDRVANLNKALEQATTYLGDVQEAERAFVESSREAFGVQQAVKDGRPVAEVDDGKVLYQAGWAHGPKTQRRIAIAFENVRSRMIQVTHRDKAPTDCVVIPSLAQLDGRVIKTRDFITLSDLKVAIVLVRRLLELAFTVIRDQVCAAALPPCPPCDDPAVLLACLKVVDCKVVEICNLERKFVLAPTSLRYWIPPLAWFGDIIEQICCRGELGDLEGKYHKRVSGRAMAMRALIENPSMGAFADLANRFYDHAPNPTTIRRVFAPLITLGGTPAYADDDNAPVTKGELRHLLAQLVPQGE